MNSRGFYRTPAYPGLRAGSGRLGQGGAPRARGIPGASFWFWFFAIHVPLVMAIKASSIIATIHVFGVCAIGLQALRGRSPESVLYVMGYLVASEPLWRVGRAMVFYESAKYALASLSVLAVLRYGLGRRSDKIAMLYFALLLPSILAMETFDRRQIAFNLSGPFSLAMCTLFLSTQRISARVLGKLLLVTLGPIVGLAAVATFSTITTENIDFYVSKVAAGGVGNNQASSIFGLGLVLMFLFLFLGRHSPAMRWLATAVGVWCGAQAALTFSRGGVATAIGAITAAGFYLLRDRRTRSALLLRTGLLVLLAGYVVVPELDALTGGALTSRFSSRHLTGRDRIIEADIMAFRENPILGVGPGGTKKYHVRTFRWSSAHTEYTRLLGEHGIFGLAALLLLLLMAVRRLRQPSSLRSKALSAAFSVWALLFMFHAAMRMAAVSFVFALGSAYLLMDAPMRSSSRRRKHGIALQDARAKTAGASSASDVPTVPERSR